MRTARFCDVFRAISAHLVALRHRIQCNISTSRGIEASHLVQYQHISWHWGIASSAVSAHLLLLRQLRRYPRGWQYPSQHHQSIYVFFTSFIIVSNRWKTVAHLYQIHSQKYFVWNVQWKIVLYERFHVCVLSGGKKKWDLQYTWNHSISDKWQGK